MPKSGIEYIELEVAFDGITVMTNPANGDVTCLNYGDLYALFGPESDGIDTWNGADSLAKQVGGNGGFPDAPLEITAPGEESGTYDAFIELAGIEDTALAQGVARGQGRSAPHRLQLLARRQRDHHGDGRFGFAARVRRVRVRRERGRPGRRSAGGRRLRAASSPPGHDRRRVLPAVADALHLREQGELADSPAVKAFVDYYLTRSLVDRRVEQAGYIALPADRSTRRDRPGSRLRVDRSHGAVPVRRARTSDADRRDVPAADGSGPVRWPSTQKGRLSRRWP